MNRPIESTPDWHERIATVEAHIAAHPYAGETGWAEWQALALLQGKRADAAEADVARWKAAERELSDAYLRLRSILTAWETPNAPTPQ